MTRFRPRTFQPSASSPPPRDHLPNPRPVEARQQNSAGSHPTGRDTPSLFRSKRAAPHAVKAFAPFEAWTGSAVPVSVSPPTVSALPRVFAAIAASDLDAAARLTVF